MVLVLSAVINHRYPTGKEYDTLYVLYNYVLTPEFLYPPKEEAIMHLTLTFPSKWF